MNFRLARELETFLKHNKLKGERKLMILFYFFVVLLDLPVPGVIRVSCLLERDWEMRTQTGVHWRLSQWVSSCRSYRTFTEQCIHLYGVERFVELLFFLLTLDRSEIHSECLCDHLQCSWQWHRGLMRGLYYEIALAPEKKTEVISVHKFLWSLTVFVTLWWLWMSNTIIDNLLRTCMNFW